MPPPMKGLSHKMRNSGCRDRCHPKQTLNVLTHLGQGQTIGVQSKTHVVHPLDNLEYQTLTACLMETFSFDNFTFRKGKINNIFTEIELMQDDYAGS